MHYYIAARWARWFSAVGLPTEHIAAVIDLEPLEVDSALRVPRRRAPVRIPAWWKTKEPVQNRSIRGETATYVLRLRELGYGVARIAELLMLRPRVVADYLKRTAPGPSGPRVKPRTTKEQRRVEATARRREKRQAAAARIAADRAAWNHHAACRDDVGCEAPAPPPSAELVDQVDELLPASEALPPSPTQWEVKPGPRGFWESPNDANIAAEPSPEPPAAGPRVKPRRWKPSANEPRWGARGSAARYDDDGCVPLQPCPITPPPELPAAVQAAAPAPLPIPMNRWQREALRCSACIDTKVERGLLKLSWPLVREMRRLGAAGATRADLAQQFGVSQDTACKVLGNRTWFDPDYSPALPRTGGAPLSQENPCK
jgi:predicted transcriptional regulator